MYSLSKIVASSFSLSINLSLPLVVIELLERELLFVKKASTEFQNCLFFQEFLLVHFLKYCVSAHLQSELHLFFILCIAKKFYLVGNFKYLRLHLDLFITAFLRCFVIIEASLPRTNFFFRGAYIDNAFKSFSKWIL